MHDRILARELGSLSARDFSTSVTTELIHDFALAQHHRFDGNTSADPRAASAPAHTHETSIVAHKGGANALTIEKFEGKM